MRIIFLDVDGPLIPLRLHWKIKDTQLQLHEYARFDDGTLKWDSEFVEALNTYCPAMGIQIVFNSSHNTTPNEYYRTAKANGLNTGLLHKEFYTGYPMKIENRVEAIEDWLKKNVKIRCEWIVVDDFELPVPHMINVSIEEGMTDKHIKDLFNAFCLTPRPPARRPINIFTAEGGTNGKSNDLQS